MSNPLNPVSVQSRLYRRLTDSCAVLALAILSLAVMPSHALVGAADDVPAATLLIPYFEVDLDNANGTTTLFTITNASATAVLSHVTMWTDLGVPVLAFDVYLTGYDVQSINLRDILVNGVLPQDASNGQDPGNQRSPQGLYSQDINFASCSGILPKQPLNQAWIPPTTTQPYPSSVESLQKELTGKPSTRQTSIDPASRINCTGHDHNDRIARGYITIDTVSQCTYMTPADVQYHQPGSIVTQQNILMGDYMIVNPSTNQLHLANAVHVEHSVGSGISSPVSAPIAAGKYTFYGRYTNWQSSGGNSIDQREPLPTNWAGMGATGHTDAIVWRDTKTVHNYNTSFSCPASPGAAPNGVAWQPLTHEQLLAFDTQEGTASPLGAFAYATGRYGLGSAAMPIPMTNKLGWMFANLNAPIAGVSQPSSDPAALQGFMTFSRRPEGGALPSAAVPNAFITSGSVGYSLDTGLQPNHQPVN